MTIENMHAEVDAMYKPFSKGIRGGNAILTVIGKKFVASVKNINVRTITFVLGLDMLTVNDFVANNIYRFEQAKKGFLVILKEKFRLCS